MNKQIVIASLFGTTFAAAPDAVCSNMVVKTWQAALKNAKTTGLEDITAGLKDAAKKALEAETKDETDNNKVAAKTYTDFKSSVQQILDDYDAAKKAKEANDKAIADAGVESGKVQGRIDTDGRTAQQITDKVAKAGLTKMASDAQAAYDIVANKVKATKSMNAQITAARILHEEEQQVLEDPLIKAKADTAAKTVLAAVAAFEYKNAGLLTTGDGTAYPSVKSGTVKIAAQAIVERDAVSTTAEAAAVKDTDAAAVKNFFAERKDFDKATDMYNAYVAGCKGKAAPADKACEKLINKTKTQQSFALTKQTAGAAAITAAGTSDATYVATKKIYDAAVKALNAKTSDKAWKTEWEKAVKANAATYKNTHEVTEKTKDTNAKKDVTDAQNIEKPLQTAVDNVKKYIAQFKLDEARGAKDLAALETELAPLLTAKIIADYNLAEAKKQKAAFEATKKAATDRQNQKDDQGTDIDGTNDDPTNFATLQKEAKETYDRVKKKLDFYEAAKKVAATRAAALVEARKKADKAVADNTINIAAAKASLKKAIAECKTAAYLLAQNNKFKSDEKVKADKIEYDKIKGPYAEKVKGSQRAAQPESAGAEGVKLNVANTLCAYPAKSAGTQPPRPQCAEGLCCGAAQRFMKDGTKMAIETCQKKDAHQYTYYPPLPATATVAPTAQTWRFNCISGAQKLVAAATAALAASYMMA